MISILGDSRFATANPASLVGLECAWEGCERESAPLADVSLCVDHAMRAAKMLDGFDERMLAAVGPEVPSEDRPDVVGDGVVYFMLIGDELKIGFTTNLKRRARQLGATRVIGYFEGDVSAERAAHEVFAKWRTHGEYFSATPECLALVKKLIPSAQNIA